MSDLLGVIKLSRNLLSRSIQSHPIAIQLQSSDPFILVRGIRIVENRTVCNRVSDHQRGIKLCIDLLIGGRHAKSVFREPHPSREEIGVSGNQVVIGVKILQDTLIGQRLGEL